MSKVFRACVDSSGTAGLFLAGALGNVPVHAPCRASCTRIARVLKEESSLLFPRHAIELTSAGVRTLQVVPREGEQCAPTFDESLHPCRLRAVASRRARRLLARAPGPWEWSVMRSTRRLGPTGIQAREAERTAIACPAPPKKQ